MTAELEQRLREAAEKATKGRWVHYRAPLRQGMSTINEVQCQSKAPIVQWNGFDNSFRSEKQHAANAAYIAAASPRNISALLEALSTERTRSEVLEKALEPFAAIPEYVDANDWSDDADIVARNGNSMLLRFCLGDMRRARAALARQEEGKG